VRLVLLALALPVLIGSGGVSVALAWGRATAFDWYTVMPAWMLIAELDAADAQLRERAMIELRDRVVANELGDATCARLVRMALDAQGESYPAWTGVTATFAVDAGWPSWSDTFDALRGTGRVTKVQLDRYHDQVVETVTITFDPDGESRVGRGLPLVIGHSLARLTRSDSRQLELWIREASLEADGPAPLVRYPPGDAAIRLSLGSWLPGGMYQTWLSQGIAYAQTVAAAMPEVEGRYEVSAVYIVELRGGAPDFAEVVWTRRIPVEGVVEVE
jgi:hypothetical protein